MTSTATLRSGNKANRHEGGLVAVARRYAADPDGWPFAPRFNPVERWYARIRADDDHEAWLLTWLPGQATELHDHGGSAGAFVVVTGALTEQVPAAGASGLVDLSLPAGAARGFGTHHVHRIVNASAAPAVSLHVYAPALRTMTRYRLDDAGLRVAGRERTGVDW